MPTSELESAVARLARENVATNPPDRPKTLMEDFTSLEKQIDALSEQVRAFKRRVQNLVGTP